MAGMTDPRIVATELAQAYDDWRGLVFDEEWGRRARCRDRGPKMFFVEDIRPAWRREQKIAEAFAFCLGCRVRGSCLADVLTRPGERGIWAATQEEDRDVIRRKLRRVRVRLRSVSDACYDESLQAV